MNEHKDLVANDYTINIEDIMHTAYLQYSLSVNVGRAIPEVRDGLKPGMRRILFAMRQLNLTHSHSYVKCAKVVGEVIGNYHPHGDQAVYDTLVRMAQEFAMRVPLVDGQGNFGSIDGDSAAAYRYTECRMQRLAEELLTDLDKETVDMMETFDGKNQEPIVLPARFPNLLVNGSTGIGVGMATNIPPHNLGEVIDATVHLIDNPQATARDLTTFIKGPDLPTGASIIGVRPIMELYETGHGVFTIRAKSRIEELPNGTERIIVTEIPYAITKTSIIEKIVALVHGKVITGISNLTDESSSRVGIRIVITVKRNEMASVVLNQLHKHTPLQTSFGAQFLVVHKNRPQVMNLPQLLLAYLDHRLEVITRRTRYELNRAEARAHILEGLIIAVDHIDEVVSIIRNSQTREEATATLMTRFELSKRQTAAILDMRLHQLTGLARDDLRREYDVLMERITYYKSLLASRKLRMEVVKTELLEVRARHADERRTEITIGENEINYEDLIQRSVCAISVSNGGYIKRQPLDAFRTQHRGGKGVIGAQTKEEDFIKHLFTACTHDYIFFFTNLGRMHWLKVYEIPEGPRTSRGKAIVNLLNNLQPNEQIRAMLTIEDVNRDDQCIVFATRKGVVKKTALSAFRHLRRVAIRSITLDEDDDLIEAKLMNADQQVMLFSAEGMACRFQGDRIRAMGRTARGVIGIRLGKKESDAVVSMEIVNSGENILTVTHNGLGKRSAIGTGIADQDRETGGYRLTNRGGKGITNIKLREGDRVAAVLRVEEGDEILLSTTGGQFVRTSVDEVRVIGRNTYGVKIMDLRGKDQVSGVSLVHTLKIEGDENEDDEVGEDTVMPDGDVTVIDAEAVKTDAEEAAADDEVNGEDAE